MCRHFQLGSVGAGMLGILCLSPGLTLEEALKLGSAKTKSGAWPSLYFVALCLMQLFAKV